MKPHLTHQESSTEAAAGSPNQRSSNFCNEFADFADFYRFPASFVFLSFSYCTIRTYAPCIRTVPSLKDTDSSSLRYLHHHKITTGFKLLLDRKIKEDPRENDILLLIRSPEVYSTLGGGWIFQSVKYF